MTKEPSQFPTLPRYHQVRLALQQRIKSGYYAGGLPLPGERELAEEFGVARVTMRSALQRLQEEGLVVRLKGKGTLPVLRPEEPAPERVRGGLLDNLVSMGLRTKVKVLDRRLVPAPPRVGSAFGTKPGALVLRVTRIRTFKGQPIAHTEAYIPGQYADRLTREALADTPMLVLIEAYGISVVSAEQTLDAVVAEPEVSKALGVPLGTPLLRVTRVAFDKAGSAVQHLTGIYHPTGYEYHMRLSRVGGETKVWIDTDQI